MFSLEQNVFLPAINAVFIDEFTEVTESNCFVFALWTQFSPNHVTNSQQAKSHNKRRSHISGSNSACLLNTTPIFKKIKMIVTMLSNFGLEPASSLLSPVNEQIQLIWLQNIISLCL